MLDPEDNGVITADSLQTVCADLGLDIPRDQMEDMVAQVDPEGTGQVHIQGLYSATCLKRPLQKRQNKGLKAMW